MDAKKKLIKDLAFKYGISVSETTKIVNSQFKAVKHLLTDGTPNVSVRLPNLGTFEPMMHTETHNKKKEEKREKLRLRADKRRRAGSGDEDKEDG